MVAATGRIGCATGLDGDPAPEVTGESTGPCPTIKIVMTLPTSAGRSGPFKPGRDEMRDLGLASAARHERRVNRIDGDQLLQESDDIIHR